MSSFLSQGLHFLKRGACSHDFAAVRERGSPRRWGTAELRTFHVKLCVVLWRYNGGPHCLLESRMQSTMNRSNELIHSFYKAARRTGFARHLSPHLDPEIAMEEKEAPMPSARTPRTQVKMALELPPASKCGSSGGVCGHGDLQEKHVEQVFLKTDREERESKVAPEKLANKYFTREQIQSLKMARLQEVAERDRQVRARVCVRLVNFLPFRRKLCPF
eukprot:Gregarina_sp_Poly_1__8695@NODE_519_length_7749_cov_140_117548_g412_i0_p3_GENE_NODE_519_length_7749_cov_140_117548_g412_i0NODE_519_length_7749_cov_140_117548_g412_i0_p3_ORF_typecomplete_len218_score22_98_NODE_519_length_7749_cov_140_117548_g412_i039284581